MKVKKSENTSEKSKENEKSELKSEKKKKKDRKWWKWKKWKKVKKSEKGGDLKCRKQNLENCPRPVVTLSLWYTKSPTPHSPPNSFFPSNRAVLSQVLQKNKQSIAQKHTYYLQSFTECDLERNVLYFE